MTSREPSWIVASYLLGCFTAGYYWTRWRTGQDIREHGSGYVGGRNVSRILGPSGFVVTFVLDAAKGALAVAGAERLGLRPEAVVAALLAVIAGHIWPVQLRFRGGKGVAVTIGALLAYDSFLAGVLATLFLPLFAVLRAFTLSGMAAFLLSPAALLALGADRVEVVAMALVAALVLFAHRRNIREGIARMASRRAGRPPTMATTPGPHDPA